MSRDPYRYFRVEAQELLEQLGTGVLELEKGSPAPELIPRLLRLAHTLKGAARVVKQPEIAESAHAVEDVVGQWHTAADRAPGRRVDSILELLDAIAGRVRALGAGDGMTSGGSTSLPQQEPLRTVRADLAEMDALLERVSEANVHLGSMQRALRVVERTRHVADLLAGHLVSPCHSTDRPDMATGRARSLAEELRRLVESLDRDLTRSVDRLEREMRQVRDVAEHLRLLPVSGVFPALERTARDVARSLGRSVSFTTTGSDVRLDTHMLSIVQGALVQAVRNAVAHGIEAEGERKAAGKPREGQVLLEVVGGRDRVTFRCHDDGRGVDLEAVQRTAQHQGLVSTDGPKSGSEDLLRLLLRGGITTSGAITEMAGRGVGLDVVREAAARLGGDLSMRTEAGRGTTLELTVPVSISSLDALLFECSGTTAAVPLGAVRRTLRVRACDLLHTADGDSVWDVDRSVPFLSLARVLGSGQLGPHTPEAWSAIVVETNTERAVIGVDRLVGTASVVLRPLPELAPARPIIAGVSTDGEGNPQIMLDSESLVAAAHHCERPIGVQPTAERAPVLVIDDSLTTRMLEQSIFESAGYEVDLATSGEEALEKVRRRRYGLFLVDVEMPGMDGFGFMERTRADPVLRDIPVILVTSRDAPEDRRRGTDLGARAYVVKSEFDHTELLETVRQLVG